MELITLERTGKAPLRFNGRLLATANGQFVGTRPNSPNVHWFEISIYLAESELALPLVVAIVYRKQLKNVSLAVHVAEAPSTAIGESPEAVARYLESFDPLKLIHGYPPGANFAARQQRLEKMLQIQFGTLVSAVLTDYPATLKQGIVP